MAELNINIEFWKNVTAEEIKSSINDLKEDRDGFYSRINKDTVNTVFECGKDAALKIEVEKLNKEISNLYEIYWLKKLNRI